jgi:hypothetical protein
MSTLHYAMRGQTRPIISHWVNLQVAVLLAINIDNSNTNRPKRWRTTPLITPCIQMDSPDPVEAIKFEMEQKGLTVKDLEAMIGKSKRVYEILNRKRSWMLNMIWKLHEGLGISAESPIKPPRAHA